MWQLAELLQSYLSVTHWHLTQGPHKLCDTSNGKSTRYKSSLHTMVTICEIKNGNFKNDHLYLMVANILEGSF